MINDIYFVHFFQPFVVLFLILLVCFLEVDVSLRIEDSFIDSLVEDEFLLLFSVLCGLIQKYWYMRGDDMTFKTRFRASKSVPIKDFY